MIIPITSRKNKYYDYENDSYKIQSKTEYFSLKNSHPGSVFTKHHIKILRSFSKYKASTTTKELKKP
jgi:hypothetical protein